MEVGPGILSRSCIALEFDETFEGCSFVPEPPMYFDVLSVRRRAAPSRKILECRSGDKERGGKGRGRMPISPLRSVKILNYASTIDDRVVLFRWIKKKGKKKKRRKGMRGFFFFFF